MSAGLDEVVAPDMIPTLGAESDGFGPSIPLMLKSGSPKTAQGPGAGRAEALSPSRSRPLVTYSNSQFGRSVKNAFRTYHVLVGIARAGLDQLSAVRLPIFSFAVFAKQFFHCCGLSGNREAGYVSRPPPANVLPNSTRRAAGRLLSLT